jgi:hypothetical protein
MIGHLFASLACRARPVLSQLPKCIPTLRCHFPEILPAESGLRIELCNITELSLPNSH